MPIFSAIVISRFPNHMIHLFHVRSGRNDGPSWWSGNRLASIIIHFRSFLWPMKLLGVLAQFSDSIVRIRFFAAIESFFSCEQFVTWSEFFFVIMNFIHRTPCSSGNRNFYSISIENFHSLNFPNRSNDCAFGNSAQTWDFGKDLESVDSRNRGVVVPHPSSTLGRILLFLPTLTRCWK